jgi:hypothetical protein
MVIMMINKRPFHPNLPILFLLLLCVTSLVGCQQEVPLPTRVALAEIEGLAPTEGNVPPTWTPEAGERMVSGHSSVAVPADGPPRVLSTPRNTPIIPTNTPRPTHTPTITPSPSPTVYQSIIPTRGPLTELGPSKLGLHIIHANDANIQEFVRRGQPAVIKALDNFGYLAEVKQLSPRTTIVGRFNTPHQNYVGTPEQAANDFVMSQLDQYLANPAVDYWEGWNEPDPGLERMGWYARFEQERVRLLASYGFRAAVGGFSTGVPELNEFALFLPAIETVKQHLGILTLHEYGAPDLTYLYGAPLPGYPAYADRGALKFRYRWYYRELLEPNDLVVPLVITEAGVDGIIGNRPGPPGTGWYDFQDYWVAQGWGRTGPEAFINQLAWYDDGVRADGYVIGFTVFTAGGIGHWLNYDINEILPQLTDYVVSQR